MDDAEPEASERDPKTDGPEPDLGEPEPLAAELDLRPGEPEPEAFNTGPQEPEASPHRLRRRLQIAVTIVLILALVGFAGAQAVPVVIRGDLPPGPYGDAPLAVVDGAGALSTMRADGSSIVSYSAQGTPYQFPAWSPGGTQIAVIGRGEAGGGALYVEPVTAVGQAPPEPTVVYESAERPPFYAYWTPDGTRLTFLTTEPEGLALRVAPGDASSEATVLRTGAPMYWAFTAADHLLVHSGPSSPIGYFGEIGLDGAAVPGTEAPTGVYRAPSVSTDGQHRAYVGAETDGSAVIALEARDGSGSTRTPVLGPAAFSFAPSGNALAFIAPDRSGEEGAPLPIGSLRIIHPGDVEAQRVLPGRIVAFFWAPSGSGIAALRIPAADNTVIPAVARVRPAVSGFTFELLFIEAADGRITSQREARLSDLFVNQVLPFFDQYALSHRFWSPDSAAVSLPLVGDDDVTRVTVIPADGSEATAIASGQIGFWSP
jgi:TolB protein